RLRIDVGRHIRARPECGYQPNILELLLQPLPLKYFLNAFLPYCDNVIRKADWPRNSNPDAQINVRVPGLRSGWDIRQRFESLIVRDSENSDLPAFVKWLKCPPRRCTDVDVPTSCLSHRSRPARERNSSSGRCIDSDRIEKLPE